MKNLSRMITDIKKRAIVGSVGRLKKCSMLGKVTALVGLFGMLVTLYLILFQASDLRLVKSDVLVISSLSANIRSTPSLTSSIKSQASKGTKLTPFHTRGDWSNVRINGTSKTGWVHKSVVDRKQLSQLVWTYQLHYYELFFVLAALLLGAGLCLRTDIKVKNIISQLQRFSKAQLQRFSKTKSSGAQGSGAKIPTTQAPTAQAPTAQAPTAQVTEKSHS